MMRKLAILLYLFFTLSIQAQFIHAQDIENIILNATWSPDGEFVSYMASDGIHVMDKQGNNHRLLTPPTGFGGWTADSSGVFIIENKNPAEAAFEWWVYPVDGTEPFQFLPQLRTIQTLAYSHDGEQIAISAQETESDAYKIWVAHADGSHLRPLAEYQVYKLSWSENDEQIIFDTLAEDTENWQMIEVSIDVNGNREPQIRPSVDGVTSIGNNVSFNYSADESYPPATFYITDILENQESVFTVNQFVADIDYSATSHSIVYTAYCDVTEVDEAFLYGEWSFTEQATVETALYFVDLESGEQIELIACGNGSQWGASFSPDGQEILFIWINDGHWDVYSVALDEGQFTNLTGQH